MNIIFKIFLILITVIIILFDYCALVVSKNSENKLNHKYRNK